MAVAIKDVNAPSAVADCILNEVNKDTEMVRAIRSVQLALSQLSGTATFDSTSYGENSDKILEEEEFDGGDAVSNEDAAWWPKPQSIPNEAEEGKYCARYDDEDYVYLTGPQFDLFKDETTPAWEGDILIEVFEYSGINLEDGPLLLFLRVMRYLHSFFPPYTNKRGGAPYVPFSLDITKGRKEFRWQCHLSEAWEGVYESLDAFTKEDNEDTTVVIRGDLTFFEALASRVRPLGRLNNNEGF